MCVYIYTYIYIKRGLCSLNSGLLTHSTNKHRWALSLISVISDIGLKSAESDIISDIGINFCMISDI